MCRVMTSFAYRKDAIGVLLPELFWVLDVMNFGCKVPTELTVAAGAIKGNISDLGPLRTLEIFKVLLPAATHRF